MTENSSQVQEEGESTLESFAAKALRLNKRGAFEVSLSQHLAVSTPSEPLLKTRLICEACFMIPTGKADLDMNLVLRIYSITLSFLNAQNSKGNCLLAYGFEQSEENYVKYIQPWHVKTIPLAFNFSCQAEREDKQTLISQTESEAKKFFLLTTKLELNMGSFQMLKNEFLMYAIPISMQFFEKLSRQVDPDIYKQILGVFNPETKEEEKL